MDSTGIIIGRFQPFHKGHELLVRTSLKENDKTIIFIGSSNKKDRDNPLGAGKRISMIRACFPTNTLIFHELPDMESDELWVEELFSKVESNDRLTIYCGDMKADSAVQAIKSTNIPEVCYREIPRSIIKLSASMVREWMRNGENSKLQDALSVPILEALSQEELKNAIVNI